MISLDKLVGPYCSLTSEEVSSSLDKVHWNYRKPQYTDNESLTPPKPQSTFAQCLISQREIGVDEKKRRVCPITPEEELLSLPEAFELCPVEVKGEQGFEQSFN